jgi:hypothetical protein
MGYERKTDETWAEKYERESYNLDNMQEVEELMQLRFLLGYACSSDG